jgi:DNA-binding IclR family transcriptional regulator
MGLLDLSLPLLESSLLGALPRRALSVLADLSDRVQAQTYLSVLAQDDVVGVESAQPANGRRLNIVSYEARRIPLHCGAAAKAILAFQPSQYTNRMIQRCNFQPFTMYTIASPAELFTQLETVYRTGYALCKEEFELGVTALAVPIFDGAGRAVASLGVCAPTQRLEGPSCVAVARNLQKSAQRLGALAAPPWSRHAPVVQPH